MKEDKLFETASREVAEESSKTLNYSTRELLNSPFHDLITEKNGKPFIYRMYITQHDYVDPNKFSDHEHTAYAWIPLEEIEKRLRDNELTVLKNLKILLSLLPIIQKMEPRE